MPQGKEETRPEFRAWTKAVRGSGTKPAHGRHWVTSRRAWFKVFEDRLECGDWSIPFAEITEAVLLEGRQALIPVSVLVLETVESSYQFGFNPWIKARPHLPFPVRTERLQMRYSLFSATLRLALLTYALYWLWRTFTP